MCLTTFSFRRSLSQRMYPAISTARCKRLLHLRRTRRTDSHRAFLCSVWSLRSSCFNLIKGKKTPSYFKFSLLLSPENLKRTLSQTGSSFTENDISAVFLNIRFQNGELTVTTGISYRIFSTDKTLEHEWDTLLKRFLTKNQISFDEL